MHGAIPTALFFFLAFSACTASEVSDREGDDSRAIPAVSTFGEAGKDTARGSIRISREPGAPVDTVPVVRKPDYDTTQWRELSTLDTGFILDLRYATDSNFVGEPMYRCGRAFLRTGAATALAAALADVEARDLRIKIWDAYRPLPVQWKLWNKVPDRRYVADPRRGSMHNRGAAVDLTLVDRQGRELNMGTPYDFFGREAWHSYTALPDSILANRRYLRQVMERHGFKPTPTEWWHYSFIRQSYSISEWEWPCR